MNPSTKKILIGLGVGCSVIIVLGIIGIVIVGYYTTQMVQDMAANLENPTPAAQKALGTETMPEGFEPHMAFKIPFLMEMVVLKEVQPGETSPETSTTTNGLAIEKDMPNNGIVYLNMIRFNDANKAEAFIRGEGQGQEGADQSGADALREAGINLNVDQKLGNGQFTVGGTTYHYVNLVGNFEMTPNPGQDGQQLNQVRGLGSLILAECPNDERFRMFYWFAQDGTIEAAADGVIDQTGTGKPGDPERMQQILTPFNVCPQ
jgi:hypothetical protein